MRFKRRYFCVEILFNDEIKLNERVLMHRKLKHASLVSLVNKAIEKFFGDFGSAVMMPSFSVVYFNSITNLAILRTARNLQKKFHTLLSLIQKLDNWNVALRVAHVSGSIRKCKKFLVTYCQTRLNELNAKIQSANEAATLTASNEPMEFNESRIVIDAFEKMVNVCEVNDSFFNIKKE